MKLLCLLMHKWSAWGNPHVATLRGSWPGAKHQAFVQTRKCERCGKIGWRQI